MTKQANAQTFGATISSLRKEKGMTQLDLARAMGVTDKAVSKWERNLSFPDVASLPKLAEVLETSVDELLEVKTSQQQSPAQSTTPALIALILKAVALAMGVCVAVLALLDRIEARNALGLLGIGLACLAVVQLSDHHESASGQ